jgi:hypothetical protein
MQNCIKEIGGKQCNQGNLNENDHTYKDGQGEHADRQPRMWIGHT